VAGVVVAGAGVVGPYRRGRRPGGRRGGSNLVPRKFLRRDAFVDESLRTGFSESGFMSPARIAEPLPNDPHLQDSVFNWPMPTWPASLAHIDLTAEDVHQQAGPLGRCHQPPEGGPVGQVTIAARSPEPAVDPQGA
jgi:hypothetical protein